MAYLWLSQAEGYKLLPPQMSKLLPNLNYLLLGSQPTQMDGFCILFNL